MKLTKPETPYATWALFLKDLWMEGMKPQNSDKAIVTEHTANAMTSVAEVFTRRNEAKRVRPSAFLACARQTYYSVQGEESANMPDNIGTTFAVGHLLHELSYAAVRSVAPDGVTVEFEVKVDLPEWWPKDTEKFNQKGHIDMLITVDDAVMADYLADGLPNRMLIDFKTMGGFGYKKHGKTIFGEDPDGFGYMAQLAVYADAIGVIDSGALLAGINRDSLTQPLFPRLVSARVLKEERDRVKLAIQSALEGSDPGEEFLERHDRDANFFCGRAGRPGYCPFREVCKDNPTR